MLYRPLFSSISLRMRKLFIATLLLTIGCGTPAFAAAQCESVQADTCNATPGCYLDSANNTCQPCPAGTYKGTNDTQCMSCAGGADAEDIENLTWDSNKTGLSAQSDCSYTITCPAYTFFNGYTSGCLSCSALNNPNQSGKTQHYGTRTAKYTISGTIGTDTSMQNASEACEPCGSDSQAVPKTPGKYDYYQCKCIDGYHVEGGTNDDKINNNTNCAPNRYTITYHANNDTGFTIKSDATFGASIKTLTSNDDNKLVNPGYTLSAWKNDNERLSILPGDSFKYNIQDNLELKAVWTGKTFIVTYDVGDALCSNLSNQECRYGEGCLNESNMYIGGAQDVESCEYPGYVFRGWKCTYGCKNTNETINPGDVISTKSGGEDMTLTAIWEECPVGYYCSNIKTENKCPAGSTTSDAGSDQIDDCHMTGGTTKICDKNNKCFTLPAAVGNVFYHGTTQQ